MTAGGMQWIGWGMAVAAEAAVVVVALRLLLDWPDDAGAVALALTGFVPIGARLRDAADDGRPRRPLAHPHRRARRADGARRRRLRRRDPRPRPHADRMPSAPAAAVDGRRRPAPRCSTCPLGAGSTERANRLVYGERVAPDETLRTFGQRLTRSIPMDELLLQLAESLRKSMVLTSAEVWTGQAGHYELAAGVPHRQPAPITIGAEGAAGRRPRRRQRRHLARRLAAATRRTRRLGGDAGRARSPTPASCSASSSSPAARDGEAFTEAEDHVLTELARQVALALHNVQLDAALQASLDELQRRNEELQQSRARIVAAGDAERRKLERNLHDGAQQHLVALAVKLRLARDAVEDDPADAMAMIDEIKGDVQDGDRRAALAGPRDLPAAAGVGRAGRGAAGGRRPSRRCPTTVDTAGIGRYAADMEAAVYFCCSRRCRTPASTPATAPPSPCAVAEHAARWASRSATTVPASTSPQPASTATASSTWPTASAPSAARLGAVAAGRGHARSRGTLPLSAG